MGLLGTLSAGLLTYIMATMLFFQPTMALAMGVGMAFFSERMHHRHELSVVRQKRRQLDRSLAMAKNHIEEIERTLARRSVELNTAREELIRRDAIGSPAARDLLKRQDEAIHAATRALESKQDQNNIVLTSMQQILSAQVEQTANMQRALRDVVGHLMSNPRSQLTLNDSIMMSEGAVPPSPSFAALLGGQGHEESLFAQTES